MIIMCRRAKLSRGVTCLRVRDFTAPVVARNVKDDNVKSSKSEDQAPTNDSHLLSIGAFRGGGQKNERKNTGKSSKLRNENVNKTESSSKLQRTSRSGFCCRISSAAASRLCLKSGFRKKVRKYMNLSIVHSRLSPEPVVLSTSI